MTSALRLLTSVCALAFSLGLWEATVSAAQEVPSGPPAAVIDLATHEGAQLVNGMWRYSDTKIIEVDFRAPGPDGQPTGAPVKTYDYTPRAGGIDFDDTAWEVIAPTTLTQRRGHGRLSFNWYRIKVTIPQRVGAFDPTGAMVVFETALDDYAEIWVDGELPRALGQRGGSVINGWNAPNRLIVGRHVTPGQHIQLAVFGSNGPLSNPPMTRLEKDGKVTVLADRFEGKRLNSPNDLVYRSDGTLYFTDPPFGLPRFAADPRKALPFSGIYSLTNGTLRLLSTELSGPNGIALSPDEKYLYVGNWDDQKKVLMRYEAHADGTVSNGMVFFDMTSAPGVDAIDGIKVDPQGNLYVSGPGGLWVLSPAGKHLGTIIAPQHVHNMAWGDADGRTLYLCAPGGLYRMRLGFFGTRS